MFLDTQYAKAQLNDIFRANIEVARVRAVFVYWVKSIRLCIFSSKH